MSFLNSHIREKHGEVVWGLGVCDLIFLEASAGSFNPECSGISTRDEGCMELGSKNQNLNWEVYDKPLDFGSHMFRQT